MRPECGQVLYYSTALTLHRERMTMLIARMNCTSSAIDAGVPMDFGRYEQYC